MSHVYLWLWCEWLVNKRTRTTTVNMWRGSSSVRLYHFTTEKKRTEIKRTIFYWTSSCRNETRFSKMKLNHPCWISGAIITCWLKWLWFAHSWQNKVATRLKQELQQNTSVNLDVLDGIFYTIVVLDRLWEKEILIWIMLVVFLCVCSFLV